MAVQRFKLPLNNAAFPFVSTEAPRAVFIPGLDVAPRAPRGFVAGNESADYDLTQIIYGENFMPVGSGVRSVGYEEIIPGISSIDFDSIFPLRDEDENVVLYSPGGGKNYVYNDTTSAWVSNTIPSIYSKTFATGSDPTVSRVTYAYVDGFTFVCFSRLKSNDATPVDMSFLYWNSATKALAQPGALISNLPFAAGTIDGITSAAGYLIVWSGITIAWAPFNGTAFNFISYANGAFTGAGNQIPEDVQGTIRSIIPVSGGFIAFTNRNAVGASYVANNLNAPWIFREVPDAGGLESYEQATVEGSLGKVLAYTTVGMQSITLNSTESVHVDLSDFIASRELEYYNSATRVVTQSLVSGDLYTKVTAVGNRYLVVSYGTIPKRYSYALVYDFAVQRWGKLVFNHVDCFYYNYGAESVLITYSMFLSTPYASLATVPYANLAETTNAFTSAPHALAFLTEAGQVIIADWSKQARTTPDAGVLIIGRTQLSRSKFTQLNRVEIEGMGVGDVFVAPSYDGRTLAAAEQLGVITSVADFKEYGSMVNCKNFNLIIQGNFDLSTLILEASPTGSM